MQSIKSDQLEENPREHANPCSSLMFCYALPILFKGRKKDLDENDLYKELKVHKSETLGDKMCNAWERELAAKRSKKKEPSLMMAILSIFGWRLALIGFNTGLLEFATKVTQPICLAGLIAYFTGDDMKPIHAYLYAAAIIVTTIANVVFTHPIMFSVLHLGMRVRLALCSMIYRKALRLSRTALGDTTIGQVVNLMTNDVGRFDTPLVIHLHYPWLGPLELVVVTYLMYIQIGVSSIFGVAAMLLFIPLQSYMGMLTSVYRLRTALHTDYRVRLMNEIVSGIQVIKMYAWEKPFSKLVEKARAKEMNSISKVNYIRGILISFAMFLTRVSVFVSLVSYVLLGQILDAEKAFYITAYFDVLRRSVVMFFPSAISQYAELMVSIRRIQTFMLREENDPNKKSIMENEKIGGDKLKENGINMFSIHINGGGGGGGGDGDGDGAVLNGSVTNHDYAKGIEIVDLKAKWNTEATEYTLDDINLKLKARQVVAVIGPVGSGKSSLIQTILGELAPESGKAKVNGSFSYASQEPWLFIGSVRQNILFGQPMDKQRYRTVVKKCALERDFELLPHGDKTIVGERGASLSGGQKARISLARAVYRESDIYLLDDPLSAVDTYVGRHLFDQCMRDFLRSKLVLLVTHQLQFLEKADLIVIMDKGKITAMGTYNSMLESGLDFAQLLTNSNEEDKKAAGDASADTKQNYSRSTSQQTHMTERKNSLSSMSSATDSITPDASVQHVEKREKGKIGLALYKKYLSAGSNFYIFTIFVVLCVGSQVISSGADYFLSYWVNKNKNLSNDSTDPLDIYYFTALNVGVIVLTLLRTVVFYNITMRASKKLHNTMFCGLAYAPMYFFNVNPSGRILNRFSKDLGQLDEVLPSVMFDVLQVSLILTGIIVLLCITNIWNLLVTLILGTLFYFIRAFYLKTSRDLKRLEAVARSPIYSHLSASLTGLSTIRAFGAQDLLIKEFDNYQDAHSSAFYTFISTNRAFGYYLDCFCTIYVVFITVSYFFMPPNNGGEVGLAITQALGMTGMVQWGIRQSTELENNMTSVERVVEYEAIEPEGKFESDADKKPLESWPEKGKIVADDLSLRYFPDPKSDYVLKSLNFEIQSCEKVGIVGRTGAGKSSLINALFRLSYNDGTLLIDERDTNQIGLHDLRRKISIIPQEPVLFSGTMRYNLDPFEQYSDVKLWDALEEVKLKAAIADLPHGLQSKINEGGSNFSVGQRQLVCLARAILRKNRILVLDEATANVDPQTDALIQTTIREKFKNCMVLTIAHRLHTIMDSDKVLVMDAGQVVEFGAPYELLTNSKKQVFHGMVMQTGNTTYENLLKIAEKAFKESKKDI